jgi:hypothetical protein
MKFLIAFCLALSTTLAFAASTPYPPAIDKRFKRLEALPANKAPTTEGISNLRIARVTYDSTVDSSAVGTHGLGVTLPAKAIILQDWVYIDTQFADSGAGTLSLECEDSKNLFGSEDITARATGAIVAGSALNTVATFVDNIAAACEVSAVVGGVSPTAGKLTLWLTYIVKD